VVLHSVSVKESLMCVGWLFLEAVELLGIVSWLRRYFVVMQVSIHLSTVPLIHMLCVDLLPLLTTLQLIVQTGSLGTRSLLSPLPKADCALTVKKYYLGLALASVEQALMQFKSGSLKFVVPSPQEVTQDLRELLAVVTIYLFVVVSSKFKFCPVT
jgi:hypothetical protein